MKFRITLSASALSRNPVETALMIMMEINYYVGCLLLLPPLLLPCFFYSACVEGQVRSDCEREEKAG